MELGPLSEQVRVMYSLSSTEHFLSSHEHVIRITPLLISIESMYKIISIIFTSNLPHRVFLPLLKAALLGSVYTMRTMPFTSPFVISQNCGLQVYSNKTRIHEPRIP